MKFAFVLMPFVDEFTDIYESGIKVVAKELGINAERLDDQIFDNDMLEQIYDQIEKCDFIIADMTGRNANVFYELGYADAIGKLTILLTQNADDIPFDLKHRPHVVYEGSIKKLKLELVSRIDWAIKEIDLKKKNPLQMSLKIINVDLERDDEIDTAVLTFSLELKNISDARIKGLSHVFLHTGSGWTFFQDDKQLKQSASEALPFAARHMASPGALTIPQNDSLVLELVGKKIVYQGWSEDAEERKDEHTLRGRVLLVAHTESTSYKTEVDLEAIVKVSLYDDDIPF